jgi:hypothetical protein
MLGTERKIYEKQRRDKHKTTAKEIKDKNKIINHSKLGLICIVVKYLVRTAQ